MSVCVRVCVCVCACTNARVDVNAKRKRLLIGRNVVERREAATFRGVNKNCSPVWERGRIKNRLESRLDLPSRMTGVAPGNEPIAHERESTINMTLGGPACGGRNPK